MWISNLFKVALLNAAIVGLLAVPSFGGETGFLNRTVTVAGVEYRFQVYVPADHSPVKKWPVILFLHGSGENGDDGIKPTDHGIGTAIRRRSERFPAIVVFPQCRRNSVWVGSMEKQALSALAQSMREFNGDPQRIYLTGISLGGYGTWHFAAQNPGKFAAIVPVAGGIVPPVDFTMPPEVESLAQSGNKYFSALRSADPYAGVGRMIGKTPVWVFHGDADKTISVTESRQMVEALKKGGGNVRYTELAGEGHGITDKVYADPELPVWMFGQRLSN